MAVERCIMKQTWNDLLFLHWAVPVEKIKSHVPTQLTIDTFEGNAWISVVPFWMNNIRLPFLPALPYLSVFSELNVRTYIKHKDQLGVYFFSLDANHWLAVELARKMFHLNYVHASIDISLNKKNTTVDYRSKRKDTRADSAELDISYKPISKPYLAPPGSLEHWLTERYCLFAVNNQNTYRVNIAHSSWPLQRAEAEIRKNTMGDSMSLDLSSSEPIIQFSKKLEVFIYPLTKIDSQ